MNVLSVLPLLEQPNPADEEFCKAVPLMSLFSAACSIMFHSLLIGIMFLLALGSTAGGKVPGDGANSGRGANSSLYVAAMLTLGSGRGAETDTAPPSTEKKAGVAEPSPQTAETVQEQKIEKSPSQPEADVIPIPSRKESKKENRRKKKEVRQPNKMSPQLHATAGSTSAKETQEPQWADKTSSEIIAGGAMREGAGDGEIPGGGSGAPPGFVGNRENIGNQSASFSGKVDSKPWVLSRSKVKYPEAARKNKITGYVLLRFHLDEKGSISRLQVVKAEPPGVFENAALASVKHWRFAPAMKDGRPVPYWVELPMPFILK